MHNQEKLTKQYVVLSQLLRIGQKSVFEMRGGYYKVHNHVSATGAAVTTKEYVEDSREVYTNGVLHFYDLSIPHLGEDGLENAREIEKQIHEINNMLIEVDDKKKNEVLKNEKYEKVRQLLQSVNKSLVNCRYFEGASYQSYDEDL